MFLESIIFSFLTIYSLRFLKVSKQPYKVINFLDTYSKKKCETAKKILSEIMNDGSMTIAQIAALAEINDRTVQRYLKDFQDAKILRREGSDTDGKWIIL